MYLPATSLWAKKTQEQRHSHQGHSQVQHPLEAGSREAAQPPPQFLHTMRPAGRTDHKWETTEVLKNKKNRKMGRREERKR